MTSGRIGFLAAALAAGLSAQAAVPSFTRAGVVPAHSLMPDDFVTIYGHFLDRTCSQQQPSGGGVYPTTMCGAQVTVGGVPAGLLAVLEKQINLRIPAAAPISGEAAIVVTVNGISSAAVAVPFGKPKVILSLEGPAYVHMPIWISVQRPFGDVSYPYGFNPGNLGGDRLEVRHNGVLLKPLEIPNPPGPIVIVGPLNGSIAPPDSPRNRLPLHLKYRFDAPGRYEVRFIGTRLEFAKAQIQEVQVDESDWTEIEVLPYSESERSNWIREQTAKMPSSPGMLIGDAIPGLLAMPDEAALDAILPELYNSNELVRRYVAGSLTMFDTALVAKDLDALIRDKGPTEEIARMLDQAEILPPGGNQTFLSTLPGFLSAGSPEVKAGTLQYLIWSQNHDWGKTAQFRNELSAMVMDAAPAILDGSDTRLHQLLAEALGSLKTDAARDLLWQMIESGKAEGQSRTALTWIGDVRDLPRLAGLLTEINPASPNSMDTSLAYSLHRAWGNAALPLLKQAARDTTQAGVRISCAKELILADEPAGFQYLLQAMGERPSFKQEGLQFVRDRFPDLRGQDEDGVLAFMKSKANRR